MNVMIGASYEDEHADLLAEIVRLRAALEIARLYVEAYCNDGGVVRGMAEQNLQKIDAALANVTKTYSRA